MRLPGRLRLLESFSLFDLQFKIKVLGYVHLLEIIKRSALEYCRGCAKLGANQQRIYLQSVNGFQLI
jgi:hypothetical protein